MSGVRTRVPSAKALAASEQALRSRSGPGVPTGASRSAVAPPAAPPAPLTFTEEDLRVLEDPVGWLAQSAMGAQVRARQSGLEQVSL